MLKKILLFSFIIISIPLIIVNIFIKDDEITFNFTSNSVVRVYRENTKKIERVPIEEYVVGVVSGEMPVSFEIEALKAQAVASRTYVMSEIQKNINKEYDVVDTVANQVYLDLENLESAWKESYTENINKIKKAVLDTSGEYLTYEGKIIEALFFSTSSGYTDNSEDVFSSMKPYLRSVDSTWDVISPVYTSKKTFSKKDFYKALNLEYNENLKIEIIEATKAGRIKKIKINNKIFTGSDICVKLALRSSTFDIKVSDNEVIVNSRGYGHNVGMSQYGAQAMALNQKKYEEILKYYYKGVQIEKF